MNRYVTGITATLACLGLGGLLSGFAPGPPASVPVWQGEIAHGRVYSMVPLSRSDEDLARQALAGTSRILVNPAEMLGIDIPGETSPLWFSFGGEFVSILTAMGPRPVDGAFEVYGPNSADQEFRNPSETFSRPLTPADSFGPADLSSRLSLWADLGPFLNKGPVCLSRPEPSISLAEARQPLVPRVTRYQEMVERYADKYGLDVSLVLAIIQTESGFNPGLISSRDAHGLMQVVPATAGGEVHHWLGRSGLPSGTELLKPDVNIRYGMAYMHLLQSKHLDGIQNPQSLEYCVIASYNGGSGALLRSFGATREEAVGVINTMTPQEVLTYLTERFPVRETRHFVRKVLDFRHHYVILAGASPAAPASVRGSSGAA